MFSEFTDSQESKGVKKIRTDLTDKAKTSEQIKGKQKHLLKTGHLSKYNSVNAVKSLLYEISTFPKPEKNYFRCPCSLHYLRKGFHYPPMKFKWPGRFQLFPAIVNI